MSRGERQDSKLMIWLLCALTTTHDYGALAAPAQCPGFA
jgi:hypothetical protein